MLEGLTTVNDLVDTGGASAANSDGTIVTITADASTITDADLVVLSQTYANDAAALAGMKTAGSDTMVFSGALADNDAILVAYTDGTNSYIAAATTSAASTDSNDLDSVETLVELTGVSSLANLDSGDYTRLQWFSSEQQPTKTEVTDKITELNAAEPMRLLRLERDKRIALTDWRASSDLTIADAWKTYRQALRDLPASASPKLDSSYDLDLTSVTWPTEPS